VEKELRVKGFKKVIYYDFRLNSKCTGEVELITDSEDNYNGAVDLLENHKQYSVYFRG